MKYGGWMGKILRINLSSKRYRYEDLSEHLLVNYIGGRGFAIKFLWDELKPKTDPLSLENKIILATGPLSGVFLPSSGKLVVATKSPLTNGYGDGNIGGYISTSIKMCGIDGIIVEGKADKPIYLYITPDEVEFKNAEYIWGRGAIETDYILRKDYGNDIGTLIIGPGGENLVKYAVVITEYGRAGGRPGIGCVFGSKKLKAIVAKGWLDIPIADMDRLVDVTRRTIDFLKNQPNYDYWVSQGTMATVEWSQKNAVLPTYNFQENVFEEYKNIGGEIMSKMYKVMRKACFSCPMPCGNIVNVKKYRLWSELDYENVAMFGSNLGIGDMDAVSQLNYIADEYGIDAISLGNVIGFTIEAFKKGYIDKKMIGGLEPDFGDVDTIIELTRMIAYRRGIGDLMAEGTMRMAEKLGGDAYKFAMHIKGLEITAYNSHSAPGMALAFGTSPIGAHHKDAWFIAWELKIGRDVVSREKVEKLVLMQRIRGGLFEMFTICRLPWIELGLDLNYYVEMFEAVTGLKYSLEKMFKISDRIYNLIRAFWIREYGYWSRGLDYPPDRWFEHPPKTGPYKGITINREIYDKLLSYYYEIRGWDENGIPRKDTLIKYGLEDVALELERCGIKLK